MKMGLHFYRIISSFSHLLQAGSLLNKRIVVRIDEWPIDSNYPLGHYVKQLGKKQNKEREEKQQKIFFFYRILSLKSKEQQKNKRKTRKRK